MHLVRQPLLRTVLVQAAERLQCGIRILDVVEIGGQHMTLRVDAVCQPFGHAWPAGTHLPAAPARPDPDLSLWDMAALVPIVVEAGGRFTGLDSVDGPGQGNAAASNGLLHDALLAAIGFCHSVRGAAAIGHPFVPRSHISLVFLAILSCVMSQRTARIKHVFEESDSPVTVQVAVKQLADALDQLLSVDLTAASRDELLQLAGGVEV